MPCSWCGYLEISLGARHELEFWNSSDCVAHYNAQHIWVGPVPVRIVYTYASDTGYGGYTVEHGLHVAQGSWPLLCLDGVTFASFVAAVCELPLSQGLFHPGRSGGVLFGRKYLNTPVLALGLGFLMEPELS